MKKTSLLILLIITFTSCEDVVDVDLNSSEPRLVIEANINLLADGTSNSTVQLTTTAPFFDTNIPVVENASVQILDSNGTLFPFSYTGDGLYTSDLIPQEGVTYTLEVVYEGETYSASEELNMGATLEFVEQRDDGGFTGDDIELKAFFTDPAGVENYYFFEGLSERGDSYDTFFDEFFDGNLIFGFYLIEDLEPGDEVIFNLYGVDEDFYNFMFVLLQQSTDASDGPFETQPATVKGNMVNQNNPDNFPLGYFRVSEVSTLTYTVQ